MSDLSFCISGIVLNIVQSFHQLFNFTGLNAYVCSRFHTFYERKCLIFADCAVLLAGFTAFNQAFRSYSHVA